MVRRKGAGAALTAVGSSLLMLLAACASGSSSSGSNSPLTIGLIGPLTGARAAVGAGMVTGAQIALKIITSHGGVLGHQVKLVTQDDAADPGDAVPAAEPFVFQSWTANELLGWNPKNALLPATVNWFVGAPAGSAATSCVPLVVPLLM